jgi:hypothetical protein
MTGGLLNASRLAWWAAIAALGVVAFSVGTWRPWALTLLLWALYELCFCPTTCGVIVRQAGPCQNPARGHLFACTDIGGHQQLKTDALWRLTGSRLRPTYGGTPPAAHRRTPVRPPASATVEPARRILTYAAVLGVLATVVQTAVGLA